MSRIAEGKAYGLQYLVRTGLQKECMACGRNLEKDRAMVLASTAEDTGKSLVICEPCSMIASWAWSTTSAHAVSPAAFPTEIFASIVLLLREQPGDPANPYQFLVVERKDEPGVPGLPGGKVEAREDALDAAVREVREETGLVTWPGAMEPLYLGYSPRGRLIATFLCRAFYGVEEAKESEVEWRNAGLPSSNFLMGQLLRSHFAGYYKGLSLAAKSRVLLQRQSESKLPLTLEMSASAAHYVTLYLKTLTEKISRGDESMLQGFRYAMSGDEAEAANFIIMNEERRLNLTPRGLPETGRRLAEEQEERGDQDGGEAASDEEESEGLRKNAPPFSG